MQGIHTRAAAKFKCVVMLIAISLTSLLAADSRWVLLVEPSFTDHKMRRAIPGSERTIVSMARVVDGEVVPLTRDQKRGIPITFAEIEAEARRSASEVFSQLKPTYVRDRRGVIEYAVLESENPLTATSVLAPEFAQAFASTLGPDLLVAIPTQFQVFVFSRQDLAYQRMGETLIASYLEATYPVSREIFALENGRLRSLGEYR